MTTGQHITDILSRIELYCPACGETSVINSGGRFLLAPGSDTFECPNCDQSFRVDVEFTPHTHQGTIMPDPTAATGVPDYIAHPEQFCMLEGKLYRKEKDDQ